MGKMEKTILQWKDRGRQVWTVEAQICYKPPRVVVLRVDGRPGDYRVDRYSITWEAIDGGEGFPTREEAQVFAARWVEAALVQGGTLFPRIAR